jgi:hypothetical protein
VHRKLARSRYAPLALTDCGDHVEWTDGKRTTAMRLPDQSASDRYPLLSSVLIASFVSDVSYFGPGQDVGARLRFVGPDNAVLAWLGPGAGIPTEVLRRVFPDKAFDALTARGVTLVRERYNVADPAFYTNYPDPRVTRFVRSFALHPGLWVATPIMLIVAIVLIVIAATGKFSS